MAAAAAAAVVVALVLSGGRSPSVERHGTVASDGGSGAAAVPLRDGVPALPQDEVTRLRALQNRVPHAPPTSWSVPFSSWTTPVDCDDHARLQTVPAVLDGLDTRGLRQQCATAAVVGEPAGGADPQVAELLYRFYLPDGVELDDVGLVDATDRGVSWTVVDLAEPAQAIEPVDSPDDQAGGVTTVRWDDALAAVQRWGPERTDLTWVDPYARWSNQANLTAATVHAVVAADPVTAVLAAVGFVNQGGIRIVRGDDGSLLLVPSSDPMGAMQALNHGTLARTLEGCLVLDHGEYGMQLVLWPFGTTWNADTQVLTVPAERGGSVDYRIGDEMSLGGGESDGRYANALLPAECASEKIWIGGSAAVIS
ncbi:hypothetical protein FHN55_20095 [Streptomyces sp. NP160]|uniref:hypothetical protein n=1 Tax=Streptomyces sp. NP160 TaxID=2586637 RepID=UPI0011188257|nr:hypothetical protein [Streptomyces sp. NP160]TNM59801.1 hypothetical protein FHN55_20095 [Streptomyces sp. NP160]